MESLDETILQQFKSGKYETILKELSTENNLEYLKKRSSSQYNRAEQLAIELLEYVNSRYGFSLKATIEYPENTDTLPKYEEFLKRREGMYQVLRKILSIQGVSEKIPTYVSYSNNYIKEDILIGIRADPNLVYPYTHKSMIDDAIANKMISLAVYVLDNPNWDGNTSQSKLEKLAAEYPQLLKSLENMELRRLDKLRNIQLLSESKYSRNLQRTYPAQKLRPIKQQTNYFDIAITQRCSSVDSVLPRLWLENNLRVVEKYHAKISEWTENFWVNTDLNNGYFRSERVDFMTGEVYENNKPMALELIQALSETMPLEEDLWLFRGLKVVGGVGKMLSYNFGFNSYSMSMLPTLYFGSGNIITMTRIPAGTQVLYIPNIYSRPSSEEDWKVCEFVVPPSSTTRVLEIHKFQDFFGKDYFENLKQSLEIPMGEYSTEPDMFVINELVEYRQLEDSYDTVWNMPIYDDHTLEEKGLEIDED